MNEHYKSIDMYLTYWGKVDVGQLMEGQGISIATAKRALAAFYKDHERTLERARKGLRAASNYESLAVHDNERCLKLFSSGRDERSTGLEPKGEALPFPFVRTLNAHVCANVTRAINLNKSLEIDYHSVGSGQNQRQFEPHTLFTCFNTWYVRGFDHRRSDFISLKLARIVSAAFKLDQNQSFSANEDSQWQTDVPVSLEVHPKHPDPISIAYDLGLEETADEVVTILVRQALAGYLLNDVRADCSKDGTLDPNMFPLRLRNRSSLKLNNSMIMAPGWGS